MRPFLERLAELLLDRHSTELDRIAVVLPGRRAGLHLRKYLAQLNGKALWSPEVLDTGAFMERMTGLTQGRPLELLFLLYQAHRELAGVRTEPLAEFMEWGGTTLRDLSEVDAHLLDHRRLYRDLREYHELEEWSFRLGELSPGQQRLNKHWRETGVLHQRFSELMKRERMGTSGFIARQCAETVLDGAPTLPWNKVWFAGLNALDPANTQVIGGLQQKGLACLAWDADQHYLLDPKQEAGTYLRRSIAALGAGELPPQTGIMERERMIRKVTVPHAFAQTTYVAQRLAELSVEDRSRTVVVLAEENLLLPLMEQLPANIGPLNVTMGIPLEALPVNGLTTAYLDLLELGDQQGSYPLTALITFLSHPFLNEGPTTTAVISGSKQLQRTRVDCADLIRLATEAGSHATTDMEVCLAPFLFTPTELSLRFNQLFGWAKRTAPQDPSTQEQVFQMARLQQRTDRALAQADIGTLDIRTYRALRDRLLGEERIDLLGEPLHGLQVMGLLETRALDHYRVLFVSANEGVLPRTTAPQSWIPFELRNQYKLPMPADSAAISAYHVHRAMQLAREVEWIVSAGGEANAGEPSRFIAQWEHEVIGHARTSSTQHVVAPKTLARASRVLSVVKDAAVMERLHRLCQRGLSPSALGTWLRCPLDFYHRYVLGLREVEVADGKLGGDVLGDAVHHVLQALLTPLVGMQLDPESIAEMVPKVDHLLVDRLAQRFPRAILDHGHFRLRREMAAHALKNYLAAEQVRCSHSHTVLNAVELDLQATLPNGVLLKGRCDRVDQRDGRFVVLDVKTGAVRSDELRLTDLSRGSIGPGKRYALQLLIYAWAYMEQHHELDAVSAGVIPLQRPSQATGELLTVGASKTLEREDLRAVGALLNTLVEELLDPTTAFVHDPESTYCTYCVG